MCIKVKLIIIIKYISINVQNEGDFVIKMLFLYEGLNIIKKVKCL